MHLDIQRLYTCTCIYIDVYYFNTVCTCTFRYTEAVDMYIHVHRGVNFTQFVFTLLNTHVSSYFKLTTGPTSESTALSCSSVVSNETLATKKK